MNQFGSIAIGVRRLTPVLAIALMVLTGAGCSEEATVVEASPRPVRYLTVDDVSGGVARSFSGVTRSTLESRLSFKVSGTIVELPVSIGQQLDRGDIIARLDRAGFALQSEQSQATLAQAEAAARNADANYERTRGLYANDNASLNDLDAARANAESAQAQVRAAAKAVEIARLNESYTSLRVDTPCSIASIDVEINENVSQGQQIALVSCGDQIEIDIDIPETLISRITVGLPVDIVFSSLPGRRYTGEIAEIGVGSAASFPAVVELTGDTSGLRSGLAAEVSAALDPTDRRIVLPVAAVVNDPQGTFVFVAEAQDAVGEAVVRRRAIRLGELGQAGIEVLDGLQPGDRVVTAGVSVIRDGQRVLIN